MNTNIIKGKRFLIVDDSPDNIESLTLILEEEDAVIVGVADPFEALKLASDSHFDILLLDARMPGMTGRELLDAIRAIGVTTPAFALSADGSTQASQNALNSGFARYFAKPYDIDEFLDTLRAYFNAS